MSELLAAEGLACRRGARRLFAGLDLSLREGELLVLRGPNGAGKTSLLRLLCGLATPSRGRVRFCGGPLDEAARRAIGYIGHQPGIKTLLSPLENLRALAALADLPPAMCPEAALRAAGLAGLEQRLCKHLSAGQQRRVALARLWLEPRRVWLLDEPFTALDRDGAAALAARLAQIRAAGGAAVLAMHGEQPLPPHRVLELGG